VPGWKAPEWKAPGWTAPESMVLDQAWPERQGLPERRE
jgi:hypothetical protein